ncbi:tripartite tricarboxylate transporter permease [Bosea sp. BK604]|uniref:tripartite tricarboxylate transporter permease n=1 Tax=Bosea sp. BK604 TaxID=2512180 RepID=UPI00104D5575|nr:tripartite tricarboxylate transporter permease [Bosea sp. BK604]TCR62527.1 putative tricarboxylic transport membrane protein [Bosea sp. BK604]
METLGLLISGFSVALQPNNLLFALIGGIIGTVVGILPGIGPVAGTALLLPIAFKMDPTASIIMLTSIYYGTMYGGTLTSVLVNVPGEAASAITCIDGYEMAKRGRAGPALAVAAIGSFIGGLVSVAGLVLLAGPLTKLALLFGPPEFFSLMLVGLTLVIGLAGRSIALALISAVLGLLIAMVGIDPVVGAPRFTFGNINLMGGIDIVIVAMGLFGIGEILVALEGDQRIEIIRARIRDLVPTREDMRRSTGPVLRGTGIGFVLGLVPGVGAVVPTVISYITEKRLSKTPGEFGKGMIEGVAGPETANNAYANAALIPLFTLGIPGSPTVAIIMGAFMMKNIIPGPFLFQEHADVVWGVIASFVVGNLILLILNLPLIPLWVSLLRIPRAVLFTLILAFCVVGAYSTNGRLFDVGTMTVFGVVGYLFKKLDVPLAPLILTLILGPLMEQSLRQSLEISQGSFMVFMERPISAGLIILAVAIVALSTRSIVSNVRGQDSEL